MPVPAEIRAGFVLQGSSLGRWCRINGIDPGYAQHVLMGHRNGPAAKALRERIINASIPEDEAAVHAAKADA